VLSDKYAEENVAAAAVRRIYKHEDFEKLLGNVAKGK
jgi:hypothetical protein